MQYGGNTWPRYSIDITGSLHTNGVALLGLFRRLKHVSLDRDNGTFTSAQ